MIRVFPQPEPPGFNADVRQKGVNHLNGRGIPVNQPLPPKSDITPCWRDCLDDLYNSYGGTCAYLCVFFERVTGGASVDHFIAKSSHAGLAYEWGNYRLACSTMNSRKREYDDVIDPFDARKRWFHLDLVTGSIFPNPKLNAAKRAEIQATITRLDLDDTGNREMRARHYQEYRNGDYTADFLKRRSPFVWHEAKRQGLL